MLKSKKSSPSIATKDKCEQFFEAILSGDPIKVQKMIADGIDVNMHHPDSKRTPLHVAVHTGHKSIASLLLSNKANVHALSDDNQTAFHVAAQNNRSDMIDLLIKFNAEINACAEGGYTPLHVAAQDGHSEMIEGLVKAGANINSVTALGHTALHESAARGHKDATIKLLELGADPTVKDSTHHFTAANMAHGNFHAFIRDIICSKMTYQQSFIQNINYILNVGHYPEDSAQGIYIQKMAIAVESVKDADGVFRILQETLKNPYYLNNFHGTMKPVVKLIIANMKQYNQDKINAKKEDSKTNKDKSVKTIPIGSTTLVADAASSNLLMSARSILSNNASSTLLPGQKNEAESSNSNIAQTSINPVLLGSLVPQQEEIKGSVEIATLNSEKFSNFDPEFYVINLKKKKNTLQSIDLSNQSCLDKKIHHSFKGHESHIDSTIALSNTRFMSCSDEFITIWNPNNGESQSNFTEKGWGISDLSVLSDGYFASAGDNVSIWHFDKKKKVSTLQGDTGVMCLIALPGDLVVSGYHDGSVKIWEWKKLKCISVLKEHTRSVASLVSLGEGRFASGASDGTIRIWDYKNPKSLATLQGGKENSIITSLSSLPSNRLASTAIGGVVKIWDLSNYQCLTQLEFKGHSTKQSQNNKLLLLSNALLIVSCIDGSIHVWDINHYKHLGLIKSKSNNMIQSLSEFPDGRIVAGAFNGEITIFEVICRKLQLEDVKSIIDGLMDNVTVNNLNLSGVQLADNAVPLLITLLHRNKTLTQINLTNTGITLEGISAFYKATYKHPSLKEIQHELLSTVLKSQLNKQLEDKKTLSLRESTNALEAAMASVEIGVNSDNSDQKLHLPASTLSQSTKPQGTPITHGFALKKQQSDNTSSSVDSNSTLSANNKEKGKLKSKSKKWQKK